MVNSFRAVSRSDATVLILGSMPGARSLTEQRYYAHPQNAFWPIMCELLKMPATASYASRLSHLIQNGVALWDVLRLCHRPGSMDADIRMSDLEVNDFDSFLKEHSEIAAVFFNGAKAQQIWNTHVAGTLRDELSPAHWRRLPSTSPAYASMPVAQKKSIWRTELTPFIQSSRG